MLKVRSMKGRDKRKEEKEDKMDEEREEQVKEEEEICKVTGFLFRFVLMFCVFLVFLYVLLPCIPRRQVLFCASSILRNTQVRDVFSCSV